MAILKCDNVTLGYEGKQILSGLSFQVEQGDYLCIVGVNGSGKSTLMKTILNLRAPMSGDISSDEGLRRREIGYLPQQTQVQRDFPASVWEIVISGFQGRCGLRPFYRRAEKQEAARMIARMGLEGMERRCYRELSGGQQQRVLLARALCATQRLLLLDEPTVGLDPQATEEFYALIHALNRNDGITVIMITHDLQGALREASHILHIGQPHFFGTCEEYRRSSLFQAVQGKEDGACWKI